MAKEKSKEKRMLKAVDALHSMGGVNKSAIRIELMRWLGGEPGFAKALFDLTNSENPNVAAKALELVGKYLTDIDDHDRKLSTTETEDIMAMATKLLTDAALSVCPHCGASLVDQVVAKVVADEESDG